MPVVSILTPTYERIQFLPLLMLMIEAQNMDLGTVEWIVVDDSTHPSHTLFETSILHTKLKRLVYVHLPHKKPIGCKRNLAKTLADGQFMVHMDDDDYYAPNYVSTVLAMFHSEEKPELIGATQIYLMYPSSLHLQCIGPVHNRHTCGGAMSFTNAYAQTHHYRNHATYAEEAYFVDNNPVMQIQNMFNINMVFVHERNTVAKDRLQRRQAKVRWIDVIQHPIVLLFYLSLHVDKLDLHTEFHTLTYERNTRTAYGNAFLVLTLIQSLQNILKTLYVRMYRRLPRSIGIAPASEMVV